MAKPLIIFGAKGIGKSSLDIVQSAGFDVLGFLDDDDSLVGTEINNIPVMGSTDDEVYLKMLAKECDAFVALEDASSRQKQVEILVSDYKSMPINAIHSTAFIPESVHIGHGNFINAGVVIGAYTKVPNHCIIHAGAILEHDVVLDNFAQIGAGATINSGAEIGKAAFIGTGAVVVSGIKIGKNAKIGAGSVVVNNVKDSQVVFGNPAKEVSI